MALFQKKPQSTDNIPLYTLGANKSVLVIGLGNPEKKYDGTRHNIGFAVLDAFADANGFPGWIDKKDLKCQLSITNLGENRVILCKPQTYMNSSGEAAQAVQHFYKLGNPQTLVTYDELAVPFGQLRTRQGGSDAGHNGIKSLISHLGDDFTRLRIGIGNDLSAKADVSDFVLGRFSGDEQEQLDKIIKEAMVIITEFIFSGSLSPETRAVT